MSMKVAPESFARTVFDYIIVGGGTAGLVLAARLSEEPGVIVGVIEAGEWDPEVEGINLPGLCGSLIGNPKYDWIFTSVPQRHGNYRSVSQPRGKALGGSSMINLLGQNRASAREYDAIETLGNPGWNWAEFSEYIKKCETTAEPSPQIAKRLSLALPDPQWHGVSGPIVKTYPTHPNFLHESFAATLENLGVPKNPDPSNGNNVGCATNYSTVDPRTGVRSYAANAYYAPNAGRPNLVVLTGTLVSAVVFQKGSVPLRATGVRFVNGGKTFTAAARNEVILSAGSFQTPQLLELSGIGNKDLLRKHGIETLYDLPTVGENLQDHVFVTTIHEIDPSYETADSAAEPEEAAKHRELYKQLKGYLASPLVALFGFLPARGFMTEEQVQMWKKLAEEAVREAPKNVKTPLEQQIRWFGDAMSAEGEIIPYPGFFRASGLQPEPNKRYCSIVCALMHPLSRGSVHIASADPAVPPSIDPNILSNPADLQVLFGLLKFALKVSRTGPFADAMRDPVAPSLEESASDEALYEYIKKSCGSLFHPLGTASMLPKNAGGVVDPTLKVYGTANLRIVDASIIPIQISAHSQATVYGIAEKAADIIKAANKSLKARL